MLDDLRERAPDAAAFYIGDSWSASKIEIDVQLLEALKAATAMPSVSADRVSQLDSTSIVEATTAGIWN